MASTLTANVMSASATDTMPSLAVSGAAVAATAAVTYTAKPSSNTDLPVDNTSKTSVLTMDLSMMKLSSTSSYDTGMPTGLSRTIRPTGASETMRASDAMSYSMLVGWRMMTINAIILVACYHL